MTSAFVQGKTNSSASTTSATVTLSSAPTSGNLLVAYLSHATSTRPTGTPSGSGWTLASTTSGAGGTSRSAALWWKVAGAGESATITYSAIALTAPWAMTIVEYSGVDTTTVLIAATTGLQGASTAYATPSITPTAGTGIAVIIAHNRTTASSTAYSSHQWAASTTGVTARVNNNLNNQAGASGYGTAWDFIGSLTAVAATGTATSPVSEVGTTAVIGFADAAVSGGSAVFVPGMMGSRRRPYRRVLPVQGNPADTAVPVEVPIPKIYSRRRPRPWPTPRINPGSWVPPPVVTPPVNPLITGLTTGRIRRAELLLRRPSSTPEPVPAPVVVPPPANPAISQLVTSRERLIGRLLRRRVGNTPVQVAIQAQSPAISQLVTTRERLNSKPLRRRSSVSEPVPAQVVIPPANPAISQLVTTRERLTGRLLRRRAGSTAVPTGAQTQPPVVNLVKRPTRPIRRRVSVDVQPVETPAVLVGARTIARRVRIVRRPAVVTPVQTQVAAPVNPSITQTTDVRGRLTYRALRRGRVTNLTPVQQVAPTNPPITQITDVRGRLTSRALRRSRIANPTLTQAAAPVNPRITELTSVRGRLTPRTLRRSRIANPTLTQATVPVNPRITETTTGRVRRLVVVRRQPATVTPQAPQVMPPAASTVRRPVRRVVVPTRRPWASAPQVAQAAPPSNGALVRRTVRRVVAFVRRSRIGQVLGVNEGALLFGPPIVTNSTATTVSGSEASNATVDSFEASVASVVSSYGSTSSVASESNGEGVSSVYDSDPDVQ